MSWHIADADLTHNRMLSEHTLQAFMQGYTLTGRSAVFPSYEAFLGIVTVSATTLMHVAAPTYSLLVATDHGPTILQAARDGP